MSSKQTTNDGDPTVTVPNTPSAQPDSLSVQRDDPVERAYFRRSLIIIGGAFLVMLFFFTAAFFLAVRGAERTVVPEIVDQELADALVLLQERELYPRLQVKYTGNPGDKGLVIDQDPEPGLYVKAGRRITVTVSRGAIVDNVEDYVGESLTDARARLASLFSGFDPLLVIREPVTYVYDEAEAGTILSQTPSAGTPLSDPRELILIVSRGTLDAPIRIPDWTDWNVDAAIRSLSRIPLPFLFFEDSVEPVGTVPRVTTQTPDPETEVGPDYRVVLRYSPPASVPEGSRYGLFDATLPEYPVPVALEVIIRSPGEVDRTLFSMPHPGGRLTFPFVLSTGTGIIVEANGEEAVRYDVLSDD